MNYFCLLVVVVFSFAVSLYGQEAPIQIQVKDAQAGGKVTMLVHNKESHIVRIWGGMSWEWGNWTFEFFNGNDLAIFVQNPSEAFTVNFPYPLEIPAEGTIERSFDLKDGSWVCHHIPIFPTYVRDEDKMNASHGCLAILAIPITFESKQYHVWTGTTISPIFPPDAADTTALHYYSSPRTGADRFTDETTEDNLEMTPISVRWDSKDIESCLQDIEIKYKQANAAHEEIKFKLYIPQNYHGSEIHRKVDLELDNTWVGEILGFAAQQTNCQVVVRKNEVVLIPSNIKIDPNTGSYGAEQ